MLVVLNEPSGSITIELVSSSERIMSCLFSNGLCSGIYEGESNENRKTEIKIRNIAPLSYKLADMLPVL
jgi:hypothetical protein